MSKRMKLVSEIEYEKLLSKSQYLPKSLDEKNFFDKDSLASSILNLHTLPDDIKLHIYSSVLKNVNEKLIEIKNTPSKVLVMNPDKNINIINKPSVVNNKKISVTTSEENLTLRDLALLNHITIKLRNSAKKLMALLRNSPDLIEWDYDGECTFNYNDIAQGSNIIDLLNYALNPYQKMISPIGAKRFLYTLRIIKVPVTILGCKIRDKLSETDTITLRKRRTGEVFKRSSTPNIKWQKYRNESQFESASEGDDIINEDLEEESSSS